jgi:integrase
VRQVFSYALRHDTITSNPVDRVDFTANRSTGDRDEFEPHQLTPDQVADVCAALRGEHPGSDGKPLPAYPVYALMVEFAAFTGLRASELVGLEVTDLSFAPTSVGAPAKCSVRVDRTKIRKEGTWTTGTPKSKRSRRTVPLPGWLAHRMADYLADVHPRAAEPTAPLWPSRRNGGGYRAKGARYAVPLDWSSPLHMDTFHATVFNPALAAVGLPVTAPARDGEAATQGVRLHDFRHSAAVAWLQAGVPVVQVSRWLGHAQPTITLNVYGDWVPETVESPLPEPLARRVVVPLRGHVP